MLRLGYTNRSNSYVPFKCPRCGCESEVTADECQYNKKTNTYSHSCLRCGKMVAQSKKKLEEAS